VITTLKLTQSAPNAPTLADKTAESITLAEISGAQYKLGNNGSWQDSRVFTGLSPNTGYTFYAKMKETETHYESPESAPSAVITTLKLTPSAPSAPTAAGTTAESVTLAEISGAQYKLGNNGSWQDSRVFTGLSPNTGYIFRARMQDTETHYASPET
jgi:outer membrane receptor for ferric coprogen and ferric-rhodotorulic acid